MNELLMGCIWGKKQFAVFNDDFLQQFTAAFKNIIKKINIPK